MRHKTENRETAELDEGSLESTEDIVRVRAYQFFEERGGEHGHDVEDWLRAEAEILGKKPAAAEAKDTEGVSRVA
jgi:Protein of unknown function (DUF2934)